MSSSAIFSGVVAAILTPLVMLAWSRFAPPDDTSQYDAIGEEELFRRNNRIDQGGQVLSIVGIFTAVGLLKFGLVVETIWVLGLGFGLMVILPVTFISAVTLRVGRDRYMEFWRFYELKHGIGLRGVIFLCTPIAAVGFVSLAVMILGFDT